MKAVIVFATFIIGGLLVAIALFGMTGLWDKFLFIPLDALQESWEWAVGLIVAGVFVWFFGGILVRTK